MPRIYEKSTKELFRDFVGTFKPPPPGGFGFPLRKPLNTGGFFTREEILKWFQQNYPKIKKGTVTAHLTIMSTNARGRLNHALRHNGADDLLFQEDRKRFRLYDKANDPAPLYKREARAHSEEEEEEQEQEGSTEFAYERDLRNYLAKNLSLIDARLMLYQDEEEGLTGIEFPVGGRFIDILAVLAKEDVSAKEDFVVIELKVSRGYERVVGQLTRYMGWVQKNLAEAGQRVQGVIVARTISEDLVLACSQIPNVRLLEYTMSVSLKPVALDSDA
jgi:hypothetical protein